MNKKDTEIDLPKMYARFAETQNLSQTAREFGLSRYHVRSLWKSLSEEDRERYQKQIADAREAAMQEHEQEVCEQTRSYLERIDAIKLELLSKLEKCIEAVEPTLRGSIAALKDASIVLKNIQPPSDENEQTAGYNILEEFTKMSKLNER